MVNLYLTAGDHNMIEVPPSQIIGRHFLSHFPSPESGANFPNTNYLSTLSKVVAALAGKGNFLAAQILQERVVGIITEISTANGVLMAKAVPALVELYQKSSDRQKFLCAWLGLTIPGIFLVAPCLEQAISQNNRLLTSTSMDHWPEYTSIDGQSVIHYAAGSNADASLEVLLRIGLDLDCRDCTEGTPLQLAARKGHLKVVKMLVGDRSTHIGPSSVLDENGSGFLAAERGQIFRSADVNAVPAKYGRTALQAAAENGHLEVVKFLISELADVNAVPNKYGMTALEAAEEEDHLEVVALLLLHGAIR